jgi:hypothetical protein
MATITTTPFQIIYDNFLSRITDDMYLEWNEEDTRKDLQNILITIIPKFEYPKFKLYDYDENIEVTLNNGNASKGQFNSVLALDEINILAELMLVEWVSRQILSIDNTRMKYSSSDFKFTSQASHIDKLIKMKSEYEAENRKSQRLYNRRKFNDKGYIKADFSGLSGGAIVSTDTSGDEDDN